MPLNFQRVLEPTRLLAQSIKLAKDRANIAVGLAAVYAHQLVPRIIHEPELAAIIDQVGVPSNLRTSFRVAKFTSPLRTIETGRHCLNGRNCRKTEIIVFPLF